MQRESVLLLGFAALTVGAAGCAWLAQISGYPLWRFVGADDFAPFLKLWNAAAFPFLALPSLLALLFAVALLWLRPEGIAAAALWAWALTTALAAGVGVAGGASAEWSWARTLTLTALAGSACVELCRHAAAMHAGQPRATALLAVTTMAGVVGAAQVWMVQVLCYRLWPLVGHEGFYDYHMAWWHSIWSSIFLPSGVALAGCLLLLRFHPAGTRWLWTGFGLQVLLGASTGLWWGPLMARLATRADGLLMDRYALLMTTHWVRVGIVTAYALVMMAALAERMSGAAGF